MGDPPTFQFFFIIRQPSFEISIPALPILRKNYRKILCTYDHVETPFCVMSRYQLGRDERQNLGTTWPHNLGMRSFFIWVACVASVSVWFRSKERPRNGILGFGRARNETRAKKCHFSRGLWLSFSFFGSLLLNRTETLATQANHYWPIWTLLLYQIPNCFLSIVFELKRLSDSSLRACLQGERVTLVLRQV